MRAGAALLIADSIIGKIKTTRLNRKVPGAVNSQAQSAITADRLNRDFGPVYARDSKYFTWTNVEANALRKCKSVMSFLRLCHDQLQRKAS